MLAITVQPLNAKEALNESEFTQAQLAQMLAPIALYPDSLLTHILIASTYPIEVVEAERWISKKSDFSAERISNKLEDKDWEPSVKALVMFPKVLERLSDDLSWTQQLGDAFLQNEEKVLQVIQDLRYQAKEAGNLEKMENVKVTHDKKNIIIQPIQKEVVYVPYYDTRHVYGNWHWSMNPPIHWDWGHHVTLSHHNPFRWHSGIHISFNYFFSAFHWHNRHVVVVDHRNTHRYRTKKHIVRSGYANRWIHKPHHRRGVTYRSSNVNKRYTSHRPMVRKTVNKHHVSPKLYSHKKDYRNNSHVVKRTTVVKKPTKHEALQRKFKKNTTYNKPVIHKKTDTVRTVSPKQVTRNRRDLAEHKSLSQKRIAKNTPSIKVHKKAEKAVVSQKRVAKAAPKYTQPKREYVKPQRNVQRSATKNTNQKTHARKSHTGSRQSEKRRERH